jgi:hypothetical protein
VQDGADFKVLSLGPKPLKNHLIGVTGGASPLLGGPHRPGQERQTENMAGD